MTAAVGGPAAGETGTTAARELAPAKVNLILHVGRRQPNGLHELCSLFASLELADEVTVELADADGVLCDPPIEGRNLAAAAVEELRAELAGRPLQALPALRVRIAKRIPVAAGLGGGSADAAAALRAANRLAGGPLTPADLRAVAARLGSDVPSQVEPRHAIVAGTGERVEPVALPEMCLVLVQAETGLATKQVYDELDRLGTGRARLDSEPLRAAARGPLRSLAAAVENDLEAAALALRPELADVPDDLRRRGALAARVSGSGPTVFGVFANRADAEAAVEAEPALPGAVVTALRNNGAR